MDISSPSVASYFSYMYGRLSTLIGSPLLLKSVSLLLSLAAFAVVLGVIVTLFSYLMGWSERKIVARVQSRHGPTYVGKRVSPKVFGTLTLKNI